MTPQLRFLFMLIAAFMSTAAVCVAVSQLREAVERQSKLLEANKQSVEPKLRRRANLIFELVPKDEASSLLMGTVVNTGDVPLKEITLRSSMGGRVLPIKNFVYIDEADHIPDNGVLELSPGSSVKLCLGSIKLATRLDSDFLRDAPRAESGMLTLEVYSPALYQDNVPVTEDGVDSIGAVSTVGVPQLRDGASKKEQREHKKMVQAAERESKKLAREKKRSKGRKNVAVGESVSVLSDVLFAEEFSASFSVPLNHGYFTQAEAQMLYFYKRDLLFERAESKDEVFENTLSFDGSPTRNLYRGKQQRGV